MAVMRPTSSLKAKCAVAYSSYTYKGTPNTDLLLLAESIRAFGNSAREWPIWVMCEDLSLLSPPTLRRAAELRVALLPFSIDPHIAVYPFAAKGAAAAEAERLAEGNAEQLLWFDRDSLVLGDLTPLLLSPGEKFSFRPVNVKNIGLSVYASLHSDAFWSRAFALCGLDGDAVGTVKSYVDKREIRFYIAAGIIGTTPQLGIFREWVRLMQVFATDSALRALCSDSVLHSIFMHQAALSLASAEKTSSGERHEFPDLTMYPLNFWEEDDEGRKPSRIDDVISLRYDTELDGDDWHRFPMSGTLERWILAHMRSRE